MNQKREKKKKIVPARIKPISVLISKEQHTQTAKISKYSNGQDIKIQQRPNQSKYSKTQKILRIRTNHLGLARQCGGRWRSVQVVRRQMEVRRDSAAAYRGLARQCSGKRRPSEVVQQQTLVRRGWVETHELKSDMRWQGNVKQVLIVCLLRCYQVY